MYDRDADQAPHEEPGWRLAGNLALLCHHHHWLKTYEGWTLERTDYATGPGIGGPPTWAFTPMAPFGQERDPDG